MVCPEISNKHLGKIKMQDWYITIFIACVIATYASRYCVINYKYEGENTEKNKVSQIIQEIKLNV